MDDFEILRSRKFARWYMRKLRDARNKWRDKAVKLNKKVEQLEFFYEGNGFKKRGLNNSIQIADYIEKLEKGNAELKERCNILDESLVTSTKNNIERQKIIDELKNRDCWKSCEYANPKSELIGQHIKDVQDLSKAKGIIKKIEKIFYSGENAIKRLSKISDILAEAETFLKELAND